MTNDPVEQSFAPLGDDLARRAAHYVRTGEDEAVLDALAARAPAPGAQPSNAWLELPSAASVASIAGADTDAETAPHARSDARLRRLGIAWVSAHRSRSFVAELEEEHAWIETVVWAASSESPHGMTMTPRVRRGLGRKRGEKIRHTERSVLVGRQRVLMKRFAPAVGSLVASLLVAGSSDLSDGGERALVCEEQP